MAEYADALIAIARPGSRGTGNMVSVMKGLGKACYVFVVDERWSKPCLSPIWPDKA
jgi:hypothetical protein